MVWDDVHLEAENPYFIVRAKIAKNKKPKPLPLHPELEAELRAIKPIDAAPSERVLVGKMLPGMWKMKSDLKRAGIEYVQDGRTADFHALRHTLGTNLSDTGAAPRKAMEIMRHSDMRLTMKSYTDAEVLPLVDTIRALPSFLPTQIKPECGAQKNCTQIRTHEASAERHDEATRGRAERR